MSERQDEGTSDAQASGAKPAAKRGLRVLNILLVGVVACVGAGMAAAFLAPEKPAGRNILLITVDSLPAERVGCYGYSRVIGGKKTSITPDIDALAERGTLFENCISQSNWTPTSMASILYSANPTVRAASHSFDYLGDAGLNHCLFNEMSMTYLERDYDRFCIQTNPYLLDGVFTNMFDYIANVMPHPFRTSDYRLLGTDVIHGDAAAVNKHAISSMTRCLRRKRNFVIYLHYMDVHEPYPWRSPYRFVFGNDRKGPEHFGRLREDCPDQYAAGGGTGKYAPEFAHRLSRLSDDYDGALLYLDERIGDLVKFLDKERLFEDTLVVLSSDHGQEFGQHGNVGHCLDMHHEQTRVPLIMIGGGMPAGARVPSLVRNIDILPTVQDYLDIHPKHDGEGLLSVAQAAAVNSFSPDREVFSCSDYPSDINPDIMMRMIVSPQRVKYIEKLGKEGKVTGEELFDLTKDPEERIDLVAERPEEIAAMRRRMAEIYSLQVAEEPKEDADPGRSPAEEERLRSLGYLR